MDRKIRVVQYINQFFAQIGGEEKADIPAELREGPKITSVKMSPK